MCLESLIIAIKWLVIGSTWDSPSGNQTWLAVNLQFRDVVPIRACIRAWVHHGRPISTDKKMD